jgi:hypothetical protein
MFARRYPYCCVTTVSYDNKSYEALKRPPLVKAEMRMQEVRDTSDESSKSFLTGFGKFECTDICFSLHPKEQFSTT